MLHNSIQVVSCSLGQIQNSALIKLQAAQHEVE